MGGKNSEGLGSSTPTDTRCSLARQSVISVGWRPRYSVRESIHDQTSPTLSTHHDPATCSDAQSNVKDGFLPDGTIDVTLSGVDRSTHSTTPNLPIGVHRWEFPGWGKSFDITDLSTHLPNYVYTPRRVHYLGQLLSTAIAGNDLTASILYSSGVCAYYAGKWAPISMLLVTIVLYLYRRIYTEVVCALPVNGGTYTALLNATKKSVAAAAACLTILSYTCTAVVSAVTAAGYFNGLTGTDQTQWLTVGCLIVFGLLALVGISESATVSTVIFVFHITTLCVLVIDSIVTASRDGFQTLTSNWTLDLSTVPDAPNYGTVKGIFFGFCAAMLGITGFETSANYVEEQKPDVFPKTLRNMWALATFFNPLVTLLALCVLPMPSVMGLPLVDGQPNTANLLANMASSNWLKKVIQVDAVLVLWGSVLTSYVGVTGLVQRMAVDRCLPNFLLHRNKLRDTPHWAIIGFCGLCVSIYYAMGQNPIVLGGVFAISFLSVMFLYGAANLILKMNRRKLGRDSYASVPQVLLAMGFVAAALAGNIISNADYVGDFAIYLLGCWLVVFFMFHRFYLLKFLVGRLTEVDHSKLVVFGRKPTLWLLKKITESAWEIRHQKMVYFIKDEGLNILNKAVMYINQNEQTRWLQFVHVYESNEIPDLDCIRSDLLFLDRAYPKMRFDLVSVKGTFDPKMVDMLSHHLHVAKNDMFISCPGDQFPLNVGDLGGVRIITY